MPPHLHFDSSPHLLEHLPEHLPDQQAYQQAPALAQVSLQ